MDHEVVQVAIAALKYGEEERYILDPAGEAEIEQALLAHAKDPDLAPGVRGLFGLMTTLHDDMKSESAACALLRTIGRVAPKLTSLQDDPETLSKCVEATARKFEALVGQRMALRAPKDKEAAPIGSIRAGILGPARRV